jgi:hypothetical protein
MITQELAKSNLEQQLSLLNGQTPVVVSITNNRHSMIHAAHKNGALTLRLHHMFLDAPCDIVHALSSFISKKERTSSALVNRYIDMNAARIQKTQKHNQVALKKHDFHNLVKIYRALNKTYFDHSIELQVIWGSEMPIRKREQETIHLGSYSAAEQLIRIHPKLDQKWVPQYFIGYVLYHEMLHHQMPVTFENGRRVLHSSAFRQHEKQYQHYEKACRWQTTNLHRLIG